MSFTHFWIPQVVVGLNTIVIGGIIPQFQNQARRTQSWTTRFTSIPIIL